MRTKKACALGLIITIISFLGFVVENVWLAITKGYINNRNMLFPFLLGYGLAVIAIYLMFGTPRDPHILALKPHVENLYLRVLIFFACAFVCISVGEWLLGTFVEHAFDIVWWNYTRLPLHITKYTSVPTSLGFAALVSVFIQFVFAPLYRAIVKMKGRVLAVLACVFMTLMVFDFVHSAVRMAQTHETMQIWRIEIPPLF